MTRSTLSFLAGTIVLATLGAALPAGADFFDGMPTGSIMGDYQALMGQFGGGMGVPGYGMGMQPSLTIGMPTTSFGDWYQYYHNQLMGLWAATGYGSLAGMGAMNGAWQNNSDARDFWATRWSQEYSLGKEPRRLDLPNHHVEYSW